MFSVIPKNLNWEILTKNLVIFKRWMGIRLGQFADLKGGFDKKDGGSVL